MSQEIAKTVALSDGEGLEQEMVDAVERFESPLLRYARQMLPAQPDQAHDVVQDAFVRLHRALGSDTPIRNLKSWLYRVTHNLAIDRHRQHARFLEVSETVQVLSESERENDRDDAKAAALRELRNLPDDQKQVLLLKILEGMTLQEISDLTETKLSTVHYRLQQGLKALAQRLREGGFER